jgi:hypothetical protein
MKAIKRQQERIDMKRLVVAAMLIGACAGSQAGIYKCVVDGRTTFSQHPCGDAAQEVDIKYQPETERSAPPVADTRGSDIASLAILDRRIRDKQDEIRRYQSKRDSELGRLRAKKAYANNNLAGATWEQSISMEMNAVAEKYEQKIGVATRELRTLQSERKDLAEKIQQFGQ